MSRTTLYDYKGNIFYDEEDSYWSTDNFHNIVRAIEEHFATIGRDNILKYYGINLDDIENTARMNAMGDYGHSEEQIKNMSTTEFDKDSKFDEMSSFSERIQEELYELRSLFTKDNSNKSTKEETEMDVTVKQVVNVAGGNTKLIIESHKYENKVFWRGRVDDWFDDKSDLVKELQSKEVQHLTVINDTDELVLMV